MPAYKDEERNTWYTSFRYQDSDGKSRKKLKRGFQTKKEALIWEREFLSRVNADMSMSFEQFVKIYFEDKRNRLKERSIKNKKYMISAKITPFFGKKSMSLISSNDILQWQNKMLEEKYSDTYLRMLQNQVNAVFNHACKFYSLEPNPCQKTENIGKSTAKELTFWTKDEFEIFINKFAEDQFMFRVLYEILFWTGCREGEMLALRLKDFDFENHIMNITKTYYRHEKKDIITTPKTEKSIRIVTIPVFLEKEIKEYAGRVYGLKDTDRLFRIIVRTVQKKLKSITERAGLKEIRVHDLRHSHIALLIEMGVSPLAIAERVGHESVNTTLNVYAHLYPNKQKEIADLLEDMKEHKHD